MASSSSSNLIPGPASDELDTPLVAELIYDYKKSGGSLKRTTQPIASVSFSSLVGQTSGDIQGLEIPSNTLNTVYAGAEQMAYFRVDSSYMQDFIINYHLTEPRRERLIIVVRPTLEDSPNSSPIDVEGLTAMLDSPPTALPARQNLRDPLTLDHITEMSLADVVKIADDKVSIRVDAATLVAFMRSMERKGQSIFSIQIKAADEGDAQELREMFMRGAMALKAHSVTLQELRDDPSDLWLKLLFFAHDMRRLNQQNKNTLQQVKAVKADYNQQFYISEVYFGDATQRLLEFPGPAGLTFADTLLTLKSKFEDSTDVICTGHTIFPLLIQFFGIPRDFAKSDTFNRKFKVFEEAGLKEQK
ncbi:hypothetical protein EUX98_g6805 [Antrodiella citrinella]|uniref:Uncharacterized protein n=1 Tax=Antrodiella citrinella TaxID=2447956 RepID=A0A4S4MQ35_9APHY|nr:hypothetical protein EUX98_g6805 [Antrodiella citrinella]